MKTKILIIFIIFTTSHSFSQKKTIKEIENESIDVINEINKVLKTEIDSINNKFSESNLRVKLNSELNSIAKINEAYSTEYDNLNRKEKRELVERIGYAATYFYKKHKYYLFKFSRGLGAMYKVEKINKDNKKIIFLTIASGCVVNEIHRKEDLILGLFNKKMSELLSEN